MSIHVNVADEYSSYPLGRYRNAWPFSGQRFREDFLEPPLKRGESVTVNLKGVKGLAPSFLEEAFGGLVTAGFSEATLRPLLIIEADDGARVDEIWFYITAAEALAAR